MNYDRPLHFEVSEVVDMDVADKVYKNIQQGKEKLIANEDASN